MPQGKRQARRRHLWPPQGLALSVLVALLLAAPARASFRAAAGQVDITPNLDKRKVYLAGHGAVGRVPTGVHDPLYAKALVVDDGTTTLAFVSVDVLGLFRKESKAIRKGIGWEDDPSKHLFVTATHTHSGPDTVGLWGPYIGVSGADDKYLAATRWAIVDLVRELVGRLKDAKVAAGSKTLAPNGLCEDGRDPVVIDPDLVAIRVKGTDGKPIGTIVRWSCHAEAVGRVNRKITADWPGAMCRELEADGGGTCLFLPGAVGGLLKPDNEAAVDDVEGRYGDVERIGKALARAVSDTLKGRPFAAPVKLSARTTALRVPVENSRYLLFLPALAIGHRLYHPDGTKMDWIEQQWMRLRHLVSPFRGEFPTIETEVSRLEFGDVEILAFPGEVFPELLLGGYDGEYSFGKPVVRRRNPAPPDLSQAPRPPYLKQLMTGRHKMVIGLTNDLLGYMVPAYDFKVTPNRGMRPQPPGDHYEETNSVGKTSTELLLKAARDLLKK